MSRAALKSRRRAVRASGRAVQTIDRPVPGFAASLVRIATGRTARAAYVTLGTLGLAALAVAFVGPKRLKKDVIKPLRGAVEPQVDRLWSQARPLREQLAGLLQSATPAGRERLVKNFQSWVGHFHAS